MVHEGIKIQFLLLVCLVLPLSVAAQESQLLSVYKVKVNDPLVYGKHETHSLEFFDDGLAVYKRSSGGEMHCDSVIPASYTQQNQQLVIYFPDRSDWVLSSHTVENYKVLTRQDGFSFLQPIPPGLILKPSQKSRKLKRQRQRCPDF